MVAAFINTSSLGTSAFLDRAEEPTLLSPEISQRALSSCISGIIAPSSPGVAAETSILLGLGRAASPGLAEVLTALAPSLGLPSARGLLLLPVCACAHGGRGGRSGA